MKTLCTGGSAGRLVDEMCGHAADTDRERHEWLPAGLRLEAQQAADFMGRFSWWGR